MPNGCFHVVLQLPDRVTRRRLKECGIEDALSPGMILRGADMTDDQLMAMLGDTFPGAWWGSVASFFRFELRGVLNSNGHGWQPQCIVICLLISYSNDENK